MKKLAMHFPRFGLSKTLCGLPIPASRVTLSDSEVTCKRCLNAWALVLSEDGGDTIGKLSAGVFPSIVYNPRPIR
jgi:hypothetical protein